MVMYATPTELAGHLQMDLDTYTATQALTLASERFCKAADTRFEPTAVTYVALGGYGRRLNLPFRPVTAVSAVRINGTAVTDFTLVRNAVWRQAGFSTGAFPDKVEVDLTHGYASAPDDVKAAVLDWAGDMYQNPDSAVSESIDDYSVKYAASDAAMPETARELADYYRGILAA